MNSESSWFIKVVLSKFLNSNNNDNNSLIKVLDKNREEANYRQALGLERTKVMNRHKRKCTKDVIHEI
jgi:hypothetical protein